MYHIVDLKAEAAVMNSIGRAHSVKTENQKLDRTRKNSGFYIKALESMNRRNKGNRSSPEKPKPQYFSNPLETFTTSSSDREMGTKKSRKLRHREYKNVYTQSRNFSCSLFL